MRKRTTLGLLTSTAAPILIVACPVAVLAQVVTNSARVAAPVGAFETVAGNNAAIETDALFAALAANTDNIGPVNGASGNANAGNVLANDSANGTTPTLAAVTLTVVSPSGNPGVTLNPETGIVSVAAGVAAGTYVLEYEICETANPANCATGAISVVVDAPNLVVSADTPLAVNGAVGGNDIINAFANDTLNEVQVDPASVAATIKTPATPVNGGPVPVLDIATGMVDVPSGTPAGTYTIEYELCEQLNPENCASASITIIVDAPPIAVNSETFGGVNSALGSENVGNVLANDTINGTAATTDTVTLTVTAPASNPGVTLDPATGIVSVLPDVPPGTYTIGYEVCEKLNPENCMQSSVTVTVEAALSSITGTVYRDSNGNHQLDNGETRLGGWLVEVLHDGEVLAAAITDAEGGYSFENLASTGGYSIRFTNTDNDVVYRIIEDINLTTSRVVVDQNLPIDPSGVVYDSITRAPVRDAVVSLLGANGLPLPSSCFVSPTQQAQSTDAAGNYRFDIIPGAAAQCPVGDTIYTISIAAPSGYSAPSSVLPAEQGAFDPTGMAAPVMISSSANPPTGGEVARWYQSFRLAAGDPDVIFNHIPIDPFLSRAPLFVTKTSVRRSASVGDLIPYTITVRNAEAVQRAGVDVVDILPPGFRYVTGTAAINGTPSEPQVNDRELSWLSQTIPANGTVAYTLTAVVGAGVTMGDRVNNGLARNGSDDSEISNRGQAIISIVPSAVFDCSELIGKVYEDLDGDGYQDEGEPGIPGARLATVNGELITSDEYGRYHIACAAVPDAQIGSNFVLKLDMGTVAQGFWPTTDNPQSIRLTRGKISELNFGVQRVATLGLELDARAFVPGSTTLRPEFASSLSSMRPEEAARLIIQINYRAQNAEDWPLAERRLAAVKASLEALFASDWDADEPIFEANVSRAFTAPGQE